MQIFAKGKPQHVYFLPYREERVQKDGFSCGDWMAMSSISCMMKAPRVSLANISSNFAVVKGPLLTEDFVYSHRQLLALLFFALDNRAYDAIDIEARGKIKEQFDRILLLLKPPPTIHDLVRYTPETIQGMMQRIEAKSTNDGMIDGEKKLTCFFNKQVKSGNHFTFHQLRGMNMLRNCGFRYSSIIIFQIHFHFFLPFTSS